MLPVIDLGFVQIPTFFLVLSIVMGLGFYLTVRRARQLHVGEISALDLALVLTVSAVIGARVAHVLFENLDYYLQDPIKIFYFWQGGFVFYGGFVLSFLSGVSVLILKQKTAYLKVYMQLFTPIVSLTYALGRIGCFLEGCCYGKFCDLPWAVAGRHPTQMYSTLWELAVFIFVLNYEKGNEAVLKKNPERLFFIWLTLHSIGRGLIEFLRDDFRGELPLVSISTWISAGLIITSAVYFYRVRSQSLGSKK